MSVALENARLFDETQRLFKESEQRAAELAIINSVQQGLAAQLDFDAIITLVGDKVNEVFVTGGMLIGLVDAARGNIRVPYYLENGKRFSVEPYPVEVGMSGHIVRTGESLLINNDLVRRATALGGRMIGDDSPSATDPHGSYLGAPILAGGKAIGMIGIYGRDEGAFIDSDLRLLQTLAGSLAVALDNARLFADNQRRARESAALAEVGRDISSTLDLPTVMDRIAHHAKELLNADSGAIFLPEGDDAQAAREFRAIVAVGNIVEQLQDTTVQAGAGIIGGVIASGRAEFVNDTTRDARAILIAGAPNQEGADERMMVAPLRSGQGSAGAMAVWRTGGQPFEPNDLEFLVGLSLAASVGMENARLFAESQQRAAELDTVNAVSQQLAGKLDIGALIGLAGEQVRTVFKADVAYVALLDRAKQTVNFPYQHGEQIASRPHGEGLTSRIIDSGKPLILNSEADRTTQALGKQVLGKQARSFLGVPIMVDGRGEGVISVQSTERAARHDRRERRRRVAQRAIVRGSTGGARAGRGGQRGQERVPGHDESRDPHADECGDRNERPAARHDARHRAA